jgi:hypothetical protein
LRQRRSDQAQRENRRDRLPAGDGVGQLEEGEREEKQAAHQHRARREDRTGRAGDGELSVDAGAGIRERRQDDRERAGDREPAARGVDAGHDGDADDPDREPQRTRRGEPLVRQELQCDQRVEDRHRRLDDGGEAGVDVLLAPGDQPERDRRVEGAEDQKVAPRAP